MTQAELDTAETLLPARRMRKRYGDVSDMTIYRWLKAVDLDFPKPIYINGRRYWRLGNLQKWEQKRASQTLVA